jgi:hypothetical protein
MKPQSILREPARGYRNFLIALLILRICSYFMLSDSIVVVQAMKAGLRAGLSLVMLAAVLYHLREHNKQTFRMHQPVSVWMYGVYLIFGMASLLWTSSFDVSLLQLLMDIEGFAFSFLYIYLLTIYRQRHPGGYFDLHKLLAPAILFIGLGFLVGLFLDPDRFYRLTHGGAVSRLGGFIINPNELGMLLVIGIACLLPLLLKNGRLAGFSYSFTALADSVAPAYRFAIGIHRIARCSTCLWVNQWKPLTTNIDIFWVELHLSP